VKALLTPAACLLVATALAQGQSLTWNGSSSDWDINTTPNWSGDAPVYTDGANVTFSTAGLTAVTIAAGGVGPGSTTFAGNAQNFTFTGDGITAGSLTVEGGTQTFNNAANTYAGATTVENGTLVIGAASGMTATTATVNAGGTLAWTGSANNTRYGDGNALTLNGGTLSMAHVTAGQAILETIGNLNYSGGSRVLFDRTGTNADSQLVLQANPNRVGRGVLTLSLNSPTTLGTAANTRQWVTATGTAPAVTNGMVAPHHILLDTVSYNATFLTYGNTAVVGGRPTTSFTQVSYTNAAAAGAMNTAGTTGNGTETWSVAAASNTSGDVGPGSLLVQGDTKNLYALRTSRSLSSAGTMITLNSGGLILQTNTGVSGSPGLTLGANISWVLSTGVEGVFYVSGNASGNSIHTIAGSIAGDNGLTIDGPATLSLAGNNTYRGDTTVHSAFTLAQTGSLLFQHDSGALNKITGAGNVTLNGTFKLSLSNAIPEGNHLLVDVDTLTESFGNGFSFGFDGGATFSQNATVWTGASGGTSYSFDESTGILSVSIPEPTGLVPLLTGLAFLSTRRRQGSAKSLR